MRILSTLLLLAIVALVAQSCRPAEANCNHPNHEQYIREKTKKRRGI